MLIFYIFLAAAAIRDSSSTLSQLKKHSNAFGNKPTFSHKQSPVYKSNLPGSDSDEDDEAKAVRKKKINRDHDALLYTEDDDKPDKRMDKKLQRDKAERERKENASKSRTEDRTAGKFKVFLSDDSEKGKKISTDKNCQRDSKIEIKPKEITTPKQKRDAQEPSSSGSKTTRYSPVAMKTTPKRLSSPIRHEPVLKKNKVEVVKNYKPFNKLLEGVVLVISGIQVNSSAPMYRLCA